jgi:uncharacterized membrane protein
MKKLLIVIGILALVGGAGAVVWVATASPERATCVRLGELCGSQNKELADLDKCMATMQEVHEAAGDERMEAMSACVDQADTCATAAGCMAGTGMSVLTEVMGDFLKGLGNTISK